MLKTSMPTSYASSFRVWERRCYERVKLPWVSLTVAVGRSYSPGRPRVDKAPGCRSFGSPPSFSHNPIPGQTVPRPPHLNGVASGPPHVTSTQVGDMRLPQPPCGPQADEEAAQIAFGALRHSDWKPTSDDWHASKRVVLIPACSHLGHAAIPVESGIVSARRAL